jgi:hypothetical protein
MRDIFALFLHAIAIIIRLARPGGFRSVVAESVLMRTTTGIAGEWTALTRASLRFWASLMSPFGVFETREQRGFQA